MDPGPANYKCVECEIEYYTFPPGGICHSRASGRNRCGGVLVESGAAQRRRIATERIRSRSPARYGSGEDSYRSRESDRSRRRMADPRDYRPPSPTPNFGSLAYRPRAESSFRDDRRRSRERDRNYDRSSRDNDFKREHDYDYDAPRQDRRHRDRSLDYGDEDRKPLKQRRTVDRDRHDMDYSGEEDLRRDRRRDGRGDRDRRLSPSVNEERSLRQKKTVDRDRYDMDYSGEEDSRRDRRRDGRDDRDRRLSPSVRKKNRSRSPIADPPKDVKPSGSVPPGPAAPIVAPPPKDPAIVGGGRGRGRGGHFGNLVWTNSNQGPAIPTAAGTEIKPRGSLVTSQSPASGSKAQSSAKSAKDDPELKQRGSGQDVWCYECHQNHAKKDCKHSADQDTKEFSDIMWSHCLGASYETVLGKIELAPTNLIEYATVVQFTHEQLYKEYHEYVESRDIVLCQERTELASQCNEDQLKSWDAFAAITNTSGAKAVKEMDYLLRKCLRQYVLVLAMGDDEPPKLTKLEHRSLTVAAKRKMFIKYENDGLSSLADFALNDVLDAVPPLEPMAFDHLLTLNNDLAVWIRTQRRYLGSHMHNYLSSDAVIGTPGEDRVKASFKKCFDMMSRVAGERNRFGLWDIKFPEFDS